MSLADKIRKTKHSSPPRIVVHGTEKVGKSTFMATAPSPIFVQTEDGLNGIDTEAFGLSESLDEVMDNLRLLANEEHDYKTVIIDSADWLERLIHKSVCEVDGVASIELAAGGYGKGYGIATTKFRQVLAGLDYLNKQKGMIVSMICHSTVVAFNDPQSEPYDRYEMKLHQPKRGSGARDLLAEWADIIGFANIQTIVKKKDTVSGDKIARGVSDSSNRLLHVTNSAAYTAGNRYGITEPINMSQGLEALTNVIS